MRARAALFYLILSIAPATAATVAAPQDAACRSQTAPAVRASVADLVDVKQVAAYPSTLIAPAGADYDVAIDRTFAPGQKPDEIVAFYRVLMDAEAMPKLAERAAVAARELPEETWQRKSKVVAQGATELIVSLPPLSGWGVHLADFTIIGCSAESKPVFVSTLRSRVSDGASFHLLAAAIVILIYLSVASWCKQVDDPVKAQDHKLPWAKYLDPVVISSGPNGKGSLSRFQILMFSVIVFYISLYSFFRLGALSDMSTTVLGLLGISAVGAAASKLTDNTRNRLSWENWVWLINAGWLPRKGLVAITRAKWADLVTSDDGVDVYHFQMLIFSAAVAVALVLTGLCGLATFKVPESILSLLGLSQAIYVGGKLVSPPSCANLDDGLTELQTLQTAYRAAIAGGPQPADRQAALAYPAYVALEKQYQKVIPMFESVLGERYATRDLSPPLA